MRPRRRGKYMSKVLSGEGRMPVCMATPTEATAAGGMSGISSPVVNIPSSTMESAAATRR